MAYPWRHLVLGAFISSSVYGDYVVSRKFSSSDCTGSVTERTDSFPYCVVRALGLRALPGAISYLARCVVVVVSLF